MKECKTTDFAEFKSDLDCLLLWVRTWQVEFILGKCFILKVTHWEFFYIYALFEMET